MFRSSKFNSYILLKVSLYFSGVACIFRGVRKSEEELKERRRRELLGGSGGMCPQEFCKFRGSEMPFFMIT